MAKEQTERSSVLGNVIVGVTVVTCIVTSIVCSGAVVGSWHSLKNYALAFKHNVVDSNRTPTTTA